jgi:hypothetical protein
MRSILLFTLHTVVFTLLLAGIVLALQKFWEPHWIHSEIGTVILFYFVLSLMTGLLSQYLLKRSKENSVPILLGVGLVRLLASLGFVFLILWIGTENILWFVVNFFTVYLLYLLFDIYAFITNLRPHSK